MEGIEFTKLQAHKLLAQYLLSLKHETLSSMEQVKWESNSLHALQMQRKKQA